MENKLWYVSMHIADESVIRTSKVTRSSALFRRKFRHLTVVKAGFHSCDRFYICNRLGTVKCENGYTCEDFHKYVKNHIDCVTLQVS